MKALALSVLCFTRANALLAHDITFVTPLESRNATEPVFLAFLASFRFY